MWNIKMILHIIKSNRSGILIREEPGKYSYLYRGYRRKLMDIFGYPTIHLGIRLIRFHVNTKLHQNLPIPTKSTLHKNPGV